MKVKLKNHEIESLLSGKEHSYPKYTTQIMNLANQNAQGTRKQVVGQLSELIQEFNGHSLEEWQDWYLKKQPQAIDNATEKILSMIESLKTATNQIDRDMVRDWTQQLVIDKTYVGLKFQEAILKHLAKKNKKDYRLATPQEESKGIDGFIGNTPVSIKPNTYSIKKSLNEQINVTMIYYEKKKDGIVFEIVGEV